MALKIGTGRRVVFTEETERFPHFKVPKWTTGTIVDPNGRDFGVVLDRFVPGLSDSDEWEGVFQVCPSNDDVHGEEFLASAEDPLVARTALREAGFVFYHSGGGCMVWAKHTDVAGVYLGRPDDGAIEDLTLATPVAVSVMDSDGECIAQVIEFPTLAAFLASGFTLEGRPIFTEEA